MNTDLVDDISDASEGSLRTALSWWEKKRLIFNLSVGSVGVLGIVFFSTFFGLPDVFGIILWGLFLNLLYSVGFLLEAFNIHYLNNKFQFDQLRLGLFLIGTITSCIVTFFSVWFFYFSLSLSSI